MPVSSAGSADGINPIAVGNRIDRDGLRGDGRQLPISGGFDQAGTEAPNEEQGGVVASGQSGAAGRIADRVVHAEREIEIGTEEARGAREPARRHADDGEYAAVDAHGASQGIGSGAGRVPEIIAHDSGGEGAAGGLLLGRERAPAGQRHAERIEVIRGDQIG
jgi:hypothetical protein